MNLNGKNLFISKPGHWDQIPDIHSEDRKRLTQALWKAKSEISKLYSNLSNYNDKFKPFHLEHGNIKLDLSRNKSATISIGNHNFYFRHWPDFGKYISGGWFEEYTYMQLQPLVESGLILDMRIGLEVSLKKKQSSKSRKKNRSHSIYQELDVVFTEGRRLYIVECKAGRVLSAQVMKLQNIIRDFGGVEGRGILASCFPPYHPVVRQKIVDSKNIKGVSGNIAEEIKRLIQSGRGNQ
ncbi:MAG: hypothetical protein CMK59_14120 [Proteobacteria bacterium]|nr:hypothetical protein [Pseudomonadota bacterium]